MRNITIKDIAKMAEVSPTTVSLVLNNRPSRISEKKKEEIRELAKKHNYTPNLNAKGLVTNKTNTIGLIIPDIENPFFASLSKTLESELKKHGYSLILINTDDLYQNDVDAINLLNNRGVDGFLLVLSNESYQHEDEIKLLLTNLNKSFVLIDRVFSDMDCNQVSFNNFHGQYLATEYIISKGYKNIGYIAPPKDTFNGNSRALGYRKAMSDYSLKINEENIKYGNYRFNSGYELTKELIKNEVDSIVVANDVMAYGAIKKLTETNKRVPEDIAVIGYDDLLFSNMHMVSLSTVKQDKELLGMEAVRLLIANLKDKNKYEKLILKPELVIRNSVL